jgi:hypothetical protein
MLSLHDKGAFAMRATLCRAQNNFFIFFISILLFLILMFISQLVLYFVEYLLVLLKTMCIYPCLLQYNILYIVIPPKYIRVLEQTTLWAIFQSVIACVSTGWSHR